MLSVMDAAIAPLRTKYQERGRRVGGGGGGGLQCECHGLGLGFENFTG